MFGCCILQQPGGTCMTWHGIALCVVCNANRPSRAGVVVWCVPAELTGLRRNYRPMYDAALTPPLSSIYCTSWARGEYVRVRHSKRVFADAAAATKAASYIQVVAPCRRAHARAWGRERGVHTVPVAHTAHEREPRNYLPKLVIDDTVLDPFRKLTVAIDSPPLSS